MHIRNSSAHGRKIWELDNDALTLAMTVGGGHIARLSLNRRSKVNPMWVPKWKPVEPWQWKPAHESRYALPLLASLCGHNLCLGWFGEVSESERKCGMSPHGEAPVSRWSAVHQQTGKRGISLTAGCTLPAAQMRFDRTISMKQGSHVVQVREMIQSLSRRDMPFTACQHVTLGPPFVEKGVTVFDMPASRAHTFPGTFGKPQRLKSDTEFHWPKGPGVRGEAVDMRMIGREYRKSSDFSTQLIDPRRSDAWFSAINPRLGVMIAYVWRRADFPWVGNWEENFGRKGQPWAGRELTRGMEFSNTPFPSGLRNAVNLNRFQGQPTFAWLPAGEKVTFDYSIILMAVEPDVKGVANIRAADRGFDVDLLF